MPRPTRSVTRADPTLTSKGSPPERPSRRSIRRPRCALLGVRRGANNRSQPTSTDDCIGAVGRRVHVSAAPKISGCSTRIFSRGRRSGPHAHRPARRRRSRLRNGRADPSPVPGSFSAATRGPLRDGDSGRSRGAVIEHGPSCGRVGGSSGCSLSSAARRRSPTSRSRRRSHRCPRPMRHKLGGSAARCAPEKPASGRKR